MSIPRGAMSRRAVLRNSGLGTGFALIATLESRPRLEAAAQTPSAEEVGGTEEVLLGGTRYAVSESFLSTSFAAMDSDLRWEIMLPDLAWSPPENAPLAVFDVRRGGASLCQITTQWGAAQSSFRVTFCVGMDYVSLYYPDLSLSVMPVVVETPAGSSSFLLDAAAHTTTGGEPRDFWTPLKLVGEVASTVAPLHEALVSVRDSPEGIPGPTGRAEMLRCQRNRKGGWIASVAGLISGITDATGGVAVVIQGIAQAVAAASRDGAEAIEIEHRYRECTAGAYDDDDRGA